MTSKKATFEAQLKDLEAVVKTLEQGELPLQDSLAMFEKGIQLTRDCQQQLDQAQQKVAILTNNDSPLEEFKKD